MQIKEIMNSDVHIVNQEDSLITAANMMAEHDCGAIPVGYNDRLVGMVTDRDIVLRAVGRNKDLNQERVKDFMSQGVHYCFEDDQIDDACEIMAKNKLRRLPVLNASKRLVGFISLADVARTTEHEKVAGQTLGEMFH